jgi:hypothetical protein
VGFVDLIAPRCARWEKPTLYGGFDDRVLTAAARWSKPTLATARLASLLTRPQLAEVADPTTLLGGPDRSRPAGIDMVYHRMLQ